MNNWHKLQLLVVIQLVFFLIELFTGLALRSLTLIGDSFHVFSDLLSLGVAMAAMKLAKAKPDAKYTYGLRRAEVLGALINGSTLLYLCLTLMIQAIQRFMHPEEIKNPKFLAAVGVAGLLSNILGLLVFQDGHGHGHSHGGDGGGHSHVHGASLLGESSPDGDDELRLGLLPSDALAAEEQRLLREQRSYGSANESSHSAHHHARPREIIKHKRPLNMDGVYLHVLSDVLNNLVVVVLGLFVWLTDFSWKYYADPALCMLMAILITWGTLPLCARAAKVLLNAAPPSVNAAEVSEDIKSLPGVVNIHDLHIWQLNDEMMIATLHVAVSAPPDSFSELSRDILHCLSSHGVTSATVQPEFVGTANGSRECVAYGNVLSGGYATDERNS